MTNGGKGGGGVKNWDFYGDILFEWPLRHYGTPLVRKKGSSRELKRDSMRMEKRRLCEWR